MTHSSAFAVGGSLALLLAGSLAFATGVGDVAAPPATARNRVADEPLVLFQKMMPVFMHPRCLNCHGVVDPVSGQNHEGKAVPPGVDTARSDGLTVAVIPSEARDLA